MILIGKIKKQWISSNRYHAASVTWPCINDPLIIKYRSQSFYEVEPIFFTRSVTRLCRTRPPLPSNPPQTSTPLQQNHSKTPPLLNLLPPNRHPTLTQINLPSLQRTPLSITSDGRRQWARSPAKSSTPHLTTLIRDPGELNQIVPLSLRRTGWRPGKVGTENWRPPSIRFRGRSVDIYPTETGNYLSMIYQSHTENYPTISQS